MITFTEAEIDFAWRDFRVPDVIRLADAKLARGESVAMKEARKALQISMNEMSRRLSISAPAYTQLETSRATLATLEKVAETLNCRLVVQIRPKRGTFEEAMREKMIQPAVEKAQARPWLTEIPTFRRRLILRSIFDGLFASAKFRRSVGWSREDPRFPRRRPRGRRPSCEPGG